MWRWCLDQDGISGLDSLGSIVSCVLVEMMSWVDDVLGGEAP